MSCQHKGVHAHFRSLAPRCHLRIVGCCAEAAVVGGTTTRRRAASRLAAAFHLSRSLFFISVFPLRRALPPTHPTVPLSSRPSPSRPFLLSRSRSPLLAYLAPLSRARLDIPSVPSFLHLARLSPVPSLSLSLSPRHPFFLLSHRRHPSAATADDHATRFFFSSSSFLPVATDSRSCLVLFLLSLGFSLSLSCFPFPSPPLLFPPHFRNPAISYPVPFSSLAVLLSFPFDVDAFLSSSQPPLLPSSSPSSSPLLPRSDTPTHHAGEIKMAVSMFRESSLWQPWIYLSVTHRSNPSYPWMTILICARILSPSLLFSPSLSSPLIFFFVYRL